MTEWKILVQDVLENSSIIHFLFPMFQIANQAKNPNAAIRQNTEQLI